MQAMEARKSYWTHRTADSSTVAHVITVKKVKWSSRATDKASEYIFKQRSFSEKQELINSYHHGTPNPVDIAQACSVHAWHCPLG